MIGAQWAFTPDECVGGCGSTSLAVGVVVAIMCLVTAVTILSGCNRAHQEDERMRSNGERGSARNRLTHPSVKGKVDSEEGELR